MSAPVGDIRMYQHERERAKAKLRMLLNGGAPQHAIQSARNQIDWITDKIEQQPERVVRLRSIGGSVLSGWPLGAA